MDTVDQILPMIENQYELLIDLYNDLPDVEMQNETQQFLMLIFQDILLLSKNCISTFKHDYPNTDSVPIVLRTIFENYINMALIRDNDKNRINILLGMEQERRKLIKSSIKFYKQRCLQKDAVKANESLKICDERITSYKTSGARFLTFKTKTDEFKKIANEPEADIYINYQRLSKHTHPNLHYLIDKDFTLDNYGKSFQEFEYQIHLKLLSLTMVSGMNELQNSFNINDDRLNEANALYNIILNLIHNT